MKNNTRFITIQDMLISEMPELAEVKVFIVRHTLPYSELKFLKKYWDFKGKNNYQKLKNLYEDNRGAFNIYQSYQKNDIFKDGKYIVSCLGLENKATKFLGVYKIKNSRSVNENDEEIFRKNDKYKYTLEELKLPESLKNNGDIMIEWGGGYKKWYQDFNNNVKKIVK